MEKDVDHLKGQLSLYEPTRENDLKLQRINDTVGRIEAEVRAIKDRIETMSANLHAADSESQKRDAETRAGQDQLQIRILWGIVSTVLLILSGIVVGYITHFFH